MPLSDYQYEFQVDRDRLNVVICIYHRLGSGNNSPVNQMLEGLQLALKKECGVYQEVQVAYVYETSALDVRDFEVLDPDEPIRYKEPCEENETHNLAHVLFMGLALLEQKQKENDGLEEQRLYLITDEQFKRVQVNEIICQEQGRICLNPRFGQVRFTPILIKTEGAGGDKLEQYIRENGKVYVLERDDTREW